MIPGCLPSKENPKLSFGVCMQLCEPTSEAKRMVVDLV